MMEYTFGQTRAALEVLKQNIDVLRAEIEEKQKNNITQSANEEAANHVDVSFLQEKLETTLQKIDETTAIIDEVLR